MSACGGLKIRTSIVMFAVVTSGVIEESAVRADAHEKLNGCGEIVGGLCVNEYKQALRV